MTDHRTSRNVYAYFYDPKIGGGWTSTLRTTTAGNAYGAFPRPSSGKLVVTGPEVITIGTPEGWKTVAEKY